ncbi:N,N-dimethylformamidase beta subunit family domain-containing protein [Tessaracoccus massiliensis]|uniref:N,N-dimethylformamidase beta subunit family domain-containing protein n=1 Tax=Tessaracoccus massiliensis TaxID=1522311 RepID=UPI00058CEC5B|nr:N,N-dimethylformamidase beta subunit family domain-containing protein [Tessaracoccus massiliensis]
MKMKLLIVVLMVSLAGAIAPAQQASAADPQWRISGTPADWWVLSGYAVGESLLPGDQFQLKVDGTAATVAVDVFRMGHYDGAGAKLVAQAPPQALVDQPDCVTRNKVVDCSGWKVTHRFDTTGWEPGAYLAKLTDNKGRQRYASMFLRSPSHDGAVTVMFATSTHAAYNSVGGYSLYVGLPDGSALNRSYTVSMHRPNRGNGADKFYRYELGLLQYLSSLEEQGVKLSYTTNSELHRGADSFRGSRALVLLGHDEYWSVEMRQHAETLVARGTNLVSLGSNAMYYRTRFNSDFTEVTSYKLSHLDPVQDRTSTGTFRSEPYPNPEAKLLGSQYDCDGSNPQTDLVVFDPNFWAFKGTGAKKGARYPQLIGHEVDKAGPDSPKGVHIGAHSSFNCATRQGISDITYYVAPSTAGVFNLGTMGFAFALAPGITYDARSVAFAKQVISNVIVDAAKGPLGNRHTERGNYLDVYPAPAKPAPLDIYITPGEHNVNGRRWKTTCEPYSRTERCRTEIWATTVTQTGGRFVQSNGWAFNNLTYKASPRPLWKGNPLGQTGAWTAADGRKWRTECDTAATGRNGCRSYTESDAIALVTKPDGAKVYEWVREFRFNNMVRFS